ncbi:MAG TPA: hypothetical protein VMY78_01095 [Solirubrobacteraceae bacterium]|nr:hypothetical protein [Solirubrobacteraceae bacterium]
MRRGTFGRFGVAVALALAVLPTAAHAQTDACPVPPYPGDAAPKEAIAQWMAYGASVSALPRELPVMASLVESNLENRQTADTDSVGFFQMRTSIWNQGEYAGYPQRPELQLKWFVDQATLVRQRRISAGGPDPAALETDWGEWIADVERPAENLRGRYGLRLADARGLIGAACVPPPAPDGRLPPGLAPPVRLPIAIPVDTTPPAAKLDGDPRQRALRRGAIVVTVGCPTEACTATGLAVLRLPRARRPPLLVSKQRPMPAGQERRVRFDLRGAVRRRVRRALRERGSVAVTVRITVTDAAGNQTKPRARTVRISG